MSERVVESSVDQVPDIPEVLEKVILFCLDRAVKKIEAKEDLIPFTALAVKDTLFLESHPADDEESCFNLARHTVEHARGAQAYAFCYDGYVDLDDTRRDAVIAEGGEPGQDKGFAVGQLYTIAEDGTITIESEPVYIGPAPNFMIALLAPGEYTQEELEERYREEAPDENLDDELTEGSEELEEDTEEDSEEESE